MPRPPLRLTLAIGLALSVCGPVLAGTVASDVPASTDAQNTAGAYLAARGAVQLHDFVGAAQWFDAALEGDPLNPDLLGGAMASHLALGDIDAAADLARKQASAGQVDRLTAMVLITDAARKGDFAGILKDQASGLTTGPLMDGLVTAWADVGTGKMSDALAAFDKIIATQGMEEFGLYHKALALAQTGDFEGAQKLFDDPRSVAIDGLRRGILAQVEVLSQLERGPDAATLIDKVYGTNLDEGLADLRRRAAAGAPIAFDVARTPQEGLAEAVFTLATALSGQADSTETLLNARLVVALRPDHDEAQLLAAQALDKLGQYDLAVKAYGAIPIGGPTWLASRIGQADASMRAGRVDDAVTMLKALADARPDNVAVLTDYGDSLRRQGHCDQAITAYSAAIAHIATPNPNDWPIYYRRGGCSYQNGDWPAASADYQAALKLAPNEPRILNELGYGYVDRGENLDAALAMIQKAVAAAPDQGYIVDSLAWALFRLGRYAEAVDPQEKASLLMPVDPVVTDHLGDVYWMVGRKREAQYQWQRALIFHPEDKDAARIRRKLDVGLDQVLQDEKAQGSPQTGNGG